MPLTLAQMLALLPDNTTGLISEEDVRDVVEALYDWIPNDVKYLAGRLPTETAHASDDFFSTYSGYTEQTPTGTATWAAGLGGLAVKFDSQSSNDLAATLKAIPAGPPLTIQTAWSTAIYQAANPGIGLLFTDGTAATSTIAAFGDLSQFGTTSLTGTLTNASAGGAAANLERLRLHQGLIHVRWVWEATNTFSWNISVDGTTWTKLNGGDLTTTITPTHMGLWVSAWSVGNPITAAFRYLRVYEADLSI